MLLQTADWTGAGLNILKYTGRAMTCRNFAAMESVVSGSAKKREVLTYGV